MLSAQTGEANTTALVKGQREKLIQASLQHTLIHTSIINLQGYYLQI